MSNIKAKKIYKTIMLIIVVSLVTFIFTSIFLYNKLGTTKYANIPGISSELIKKIYSVRQIMDSEYISDVNEEDLVEGAIKGYVEGLGDEYTEYFTKEEMDEFRQDVEGNYVGIGIYMVYNTEDNTILVLTPIKDSPAEKAGILPGDIIRKVDGVEYTGEDFEKVATNIKGKEGTIVKLEIERDNEIKNFEIERKEIDLYPIESEMLENKIAYINISSFDDECSKDFKNAYKELAKEDINGLIIDLRNNGGGILEEALEIADYILEKNETILITRDKSGKEEIEKSTNNPIISTSIVVLVNENTASASEILTAALKENGKATVVGEKTYGKGVIQELITLSDGSGIKITTEEYYTPNRNKINKVGIIPDKEVALPEDIESEIEVEKEEDTQLNEAIKILKK